MNKYLFNIDNQDYKVEILSIEGGSAKVSVNDQVIDIRIKQDENSSMPVASPATAPVSVAVEKTETSPKTESAPVSVATGNGKVVATLKAPLPGILTVLKVKVGDRVKEDDELLILEAMKMENIVTSECAGVVLAIKANTGQPVMQDDVLIEFGA